MAFNVGVNVLEVDGRASPTIVAAPISVAGLLVRSQRGIPSLPVHVRGMVDYASSFGGPTSTTFGDHAARGFFENGGTEAYVVRLVGAGALAASVTLNDRAAAPVPTLVVRAGQLGRRDPGVWGNALSVAIADHPRGTTAIPAQVLSANAEPYALVANQTLIMEANGAAPVTVTFAAADFATIGAATATEVVASINRQTTAVRAVAAPGGRVLLVSPVTGPPSRIVLTGTSTAILGFTAATANSDGGLVAGTTLAAIQGVGGLLPGSAVRIESRGHVIGATAPAAALTNNSGIDVTVDGVGPAVPIRFTNADFVGGVAAATVGEIVAAINRQARGFSAALQQGNVLVLMSDRFGPPSAVATTAPGGGAPDATASLGLTGAAVVAGARQLRELVTVAESQRLVSWAGGLAIPANLSRVESAEFDLIVRRDGVEVERFESLSMQAALEYDVAAVVNDGSAGSRFVTVEKLATNASGPGANVPAATTGPNGAALGVAPADVGNDGGVPSEADYLGDPALRTGFYALDTVDVQLLACPDTTAPGVVAGALAYCERRGDAMFVGTVPRGLDLDGVKAYASAFRARKVFGALYAPWIEIVNPLDTNGLAPRLLVPPVGHILGVYARIAEARGVWKAPAGDEAQIANALGVELDMTDREHTDLVRNGSVNGVRSIPGSGVIVDASRTLSTDTRWLFVNVRRLFNFVKVSLRDGLRFVSQEPHSEELRRMVRLNVVRPFLLGLWRQGAFGSDPTDLVFTIKCDAENNPPAEVNLGNFRLEVFFYPVKPAETVVIVVGQQDSGAAAAEA